MNVQIMLFKVIVFYLILGAHRPNISQGNLGRLLHHVSHLAGHFKLAFSRHHIDLDLQCVSPCAGPGQTSDNSYLVLLIGVLKGNLFFSQIFFQIRFCGPNTRFFILQIFSCRFSADIPNPPLQVSNSRLSGIIVNDFL